MGTNYHNEVLRKARVLERQRQANSFSQMVPADDQTNTSQIIGNIKSDRARADRESSQQHGIAFGGSEQVVGVNRDRQAYDHSRNGPVRDDSNWSLRLEANSQYGRKPKHMHNVWKG